MPRTVTALALLCTLSLLLPALRHAPAAEAAKAETPRNIDIGFRNLALTLPAGWTALTVGNQIFFLDPAHTVTFRLFKPKPEDRRAFHQFVATQYPDWLIVEKSKVEYAGIKGSQYRMRRSQTPDRELFIIWLEAKKTKDTPKENLLAVGRWRDPEGKTAVLHLLGSLNDASVMEEVLSAAEASAPRETFETLRQEFSQEEKVRTRVPKKKTKCATCNGLGYLTKEYGLKYLCTACDGAGYTAETEAWSVCRACNGTGKIVGHDCLVCGGKGKVLEKAATTPKLVLLPADPNLLKHLEHGLDPARAAADEAAEAATVAEAGGEGETAAADAATGDGAAVKNWVRAGRRLDTARRNDDPAARLLWEALPPLARNTLLDLALEDEGYAPSDRQRALLAEGLAAALAKLGEEDRAAALALLGVE